LSRSPVPLCQDSALIAVIDVTTRNGVTASVTRGNGAGFGCAAASLAIATAVPAKALPAIRTRISRRDPSVGALLALGGGVLFMGIFLRHGLWERSRSGPH